MFRNRVLQRIRLVIYLVIFWFSCLAQTTYQYDQKHQLIQVNYNDGTSIIYTYDDLGNRINYQITNGQVVDLSIQAGATLSPNSIPYGTSGAVDCVLENTETSTANAVYLYAYLSTDGTYDASDIQVGNQYAASITGNGTSAENFNITIPNNTAEGTYYLILFVDAPESITETDETNNTLAIPITVTGITLPNLVVQNAAVSSTSIEEGTSANISYTIANTETVVGNNSTSFGCYLSTDNVYDTGDIELVDATTTIPALAASATNPNTGSITIPNGTVAGNYYLIFYTDSNAQEDETDETDNTVALAITVTATNTTAPVAGFLADITSICEGQSTQITDTSTGNPTSWSWSFPGGTPSSSTDQNPSVTYATAGTYDVTLTVSNVDGSDTQTLNSYITVGNGGSGGTIGGWIFAEQYQEGSTGSIYVSDIFTTPNNETYVTGDFTGILNISGQQISSDDIYDFNIFIAKYDASNNLIWIREYGLPDSAERGPAEIKVDNDGYIYISGNFAGQIEIGGQIIQGYDQTTPYNYDTYVARLNPNGISASWIQHTENLSGNSGEFGRNIEIDGNNVYFTGAFDGTTRFGSTTLTANGFYDTFITSLNKTTGNFNWVKQIGGTNLIYPTDIELDDIGNFYITGYFRDNCSFVGSSTSFTVSNYEDGFFAKYDINGNFQWAKQIQNNYNIRTRFLHYQNNSIYLAGEFQENDMTFGGSTLINNGGWDAMVLKYDSNGNEIWGKGYGGVNNELGSDIVGDGNDIFLTGRFYNIVNFGSFTLGIGNNPSYSNLYLLGLNDSGNEILAEYVEGSGNVAGNRIELKSNGNLFVSGVSPDGTSFGNITVNGDSQIFIAEYEQGNSVSCNPFTTTITPSSNTICQGSNITLSAESGYSYTWSTGETTQNINVINAGAYTVTVSDCNACTSTANISISNSTLNAVCSSIDATSNTSNDGSFSVNISGGTSPYTLDWIGTTIGNQVATNGNNTIFNLPIGTYDITITDNDGCVSTCSMNILEANNCLVVTNTNDSGLGSLREAINCANTNPGADLISFNFTTGTSPYTISVLSELPSLIDASTTIDGSINGYSSDEIILSGISLTDPNEHGISIQGSNCSIYGIHIDAFPKAGISIYSSPSNTIIGEINKPNILTNNGWGVLAFANTNLIEVRGNYVGTTPSGQVAGNTETGIYFLQSSNIIVESNICKYNKTGATTDECQSVQVGGILKGNVFAGNTLLGFYAVETQDITIQGNYMGVLSDGVTVESNTYHGLRLIGVFNCLVGGSISGEENIISGNGTHGIGIGYQGFTDNNIDIIGNFIGTNKTAILDLGNSCNGIDKQPDPTSIVTNINIENNTIAYNGCVGVYLVDAQSQSWKISQNEFFCNNSGLNVPVGANSDSNTPIVTSVTTNEVIGTGNINHTIEVFITESNCNTFDCQQGRYFLGTTVVNNIGEWSLSGLNINSGEYITATATSPTNHTSEFATCVLFDSTLPNSFPIDITTTSPSCGQLNGSITISHPSSSDTYTYAWDTGDIGSMVSGLASGNYVVTITNSTGQSVIENVILMDAIESPFAETVLNFGGKWQRLAVYDEHVFIVGYFNNPIDLNGVPLTPIGSQDAYLAKVDKYGNVVWHQQLSFGASKAFRLWDVEVDNAGNVYIYGHSNMATTEILNLGNGIAVSIPPQGEVVAKYNNNGVAQWATMVSGNYSVNSFDINKSNGDVYIMTYNISVGEYGYIKRFNGLTGTQLASKYFQITKGYYQQLFFDVSETGKVFFTGNMIEPFTNTTGNYTFKLNGIPIINDPLAKPYLISLDENLDYQWQIETSGDISTNSNGDIYCGGNIYDSSGILLGTYPDSYHQTQIDGLDNYYTRSAITGISKYDINNNLVWNYNDIGASTITLSKFGAEQNIVATTGFYSTSLTVGDTTLNQVTTDQGFLVILSTESLDAQSINLGNDTLICAGDVLTLDAGSTLQADYNYQWSTGETTPTIQVSSSGNYAVTVSNLGGTCSIMDDINITTSQGTSTLNESICAGASYSFGTQTLFGPGTYTETLTNYLGCDSVVTLNLTITNNPSAEFVVDNISGLTLTITNSSLDYDNATVNWGDGNSEPFLTTQMVHNYSTYGNYNVCIISNSISCGNDTSCESVSVIDCSSLSSSVNITDADCGVNNGSAIISVTGGSGNYGYSWDNGLVTNSSTSLFGGSYSVTISDDNTSCLDTILFVINAIVSPTINISETICQGDSFEGYTASGTYTDTFTAINGCDSIRTLVLTVNPSITSNITQTICQGQSFEGYTASGTYTDTFTATNGCDSIRTLELTVSSSITSNVIETICQGNSFEGYTASGTYTDTFTATNGCDSIRTLELTVNSSITSNVIETICQGNSFEGYTASGTYTDTFTATNGCDSIRTLELTVNSSITSNVIETICQGDSFEGYTASGTYTDTFTGTNGCDSIRTLILIVNPSITSNITQAICQGQSFEGYTASGTYTDTFTATNGCDSIRTLVLTVNPSITSNISQAICQGQSFEGYTASGTYTDTFTAINGCDSIRTLVLTVNPSITSNITQTICQGQSFEGYTASGTYTDTFTAINGCDSIRTLVLTVNPSITSNITQTICQGQSFEGYTASGTYTDTFTAINGCDSIRTLVLTVNPSITSNITQTICQGQSFEGYTASGTYTDTFTAINGCDSIRTLVLTVNPSITSNITQTICQGQSFEGYTASGTYTDTFTATNGCDSIRTLVLTVNPSITSNISQAICQGQSFEGYTASGTYTDTFTAINGCDSIRTLVLTVNPSITSNITQTICQGQSFEGYTASGTYTDTFTATNGCDSIRTLVLTVNPSITSNISQAICQGQSFEGYTASGTYTDTFTAINGCDSIRTLVLIVNPSITSNITQAICQGQSFEGYTASGTYTDTFTATNGCDSIRTLILIVNPSITSNITQAICQGQSFEGYTASGTYTDTFTATNGCDSIRTLVLTVNPSITSNISQAICQGQSFEGYTASGTYTDTFTAINGCDSIRTLVLTVNPSITSNITQTICQGQSFEGYTASGTYTDTFTATNGCDSIRTLVLTVNPSITSNISQAICQGQSFEGYTASGTYTDTFTGINGCDSIRTLVLTVNPSITSNITQTICQGQSFEGYTASGTYTDTFTATNGCDSIRTLVLTVNPSITSNISQAICQGQSFEGYTASGTYTDTFTGTNGCDSIRTLILIVNPSITSNITQAICQGQSFEGYTASGTYTDTFTATNGCDSIRTLVLTVNPSITSNITQTICQGQLFEGYTTSGTYTDIFTATNGCDSIRTLVLTVNPSITSNITQVICQGQLFEGYTASGTYTDTFTATNGCDSIRTLVLTVNPSITSNITQTICQGQSFEDYTASGTYTDIFTATNGCDSIRTLVLTVNPSITSNISQAICQGQSFEGYTASGTYTDTFTGTNGCDSIRTLILIVNPSITSNITQAICQGQSFEGYTASGTYTDTFTATNGCDSIRTLVLTVNPSITSNITQTICQGQLFEGYTTSGTYTDIFTATNGCDSIRILELIVNLSITSNTSQTICQGDSYNIGTSTYTASGTYTDLLTTSNGCDSTVITTLTVLPNITNNIIQTLCLEDYLMINGTVYNESNSSGIEIIPNGNWQNCDSIINVNLDFYPQSHNIIDPQLCYGESIEVNGNLYDMFTPNGVEIIQGGSWTGCDSTINILLSFYPQESSTYQDTLCSYDSYSFNGTVYDINNPSGIETVINQYGCDSVINIELTFEDINPSFQIADISCNGLSNGSILGTNSNYYYEWSNGAIDVNYIDNLSAGTYTVTVTSTSPSCLNSFTFEIDEPNELAPMLSIANGNCNELGTASINPIGGSVPYQIEWSNGDTLNTITNLESGNYFVTITDDNQCQVVEGLSINNIEELGLNSVVTNTSCNGFTNGSIDISVFGGNPPYSYNWNNGTYFTEDLYGLTTGGYTLIVMDSDDCIIANGFVIEEPAPLEVDILTSDNSILANPNGGTPPYLYQWSNGVSDALNENLITGTYTLTLTDANNCELITSVELVNSVSNSEIKELINYNLYPNPTLDEIFLEGNLSSTENINIKLFDVLGRLIIDYEIETNTFKEVIDLSEYPSGTYFIDLEIQGQHKINKVIKL